MPALNPQVGETWESDDPSQGRTVRAVVIALGNDGLRLMARTGRRISFPLRSFLQVWRFYAPEPLPQLCHHASCENIAFFRNHAGEWICQDHTPYGASVLFPNEDLRPEVERLECPECESRNVQAAGLHWNPSRTRSYAMHSCNNCTAAWFLIQGRGTESDGIFFAEDLSTLATQLGNAEIRLGFVARQSLTRAIGMRSANHLGGFTLVTNNQYGDNTALVIRRGREVTPVSSPPDISQIEIELGSVWRLRGSGYLVVVLSTDATGITIRTSGRTQGALLPQTQEGTFVLSREDFLRDYEFTRAPLPENVRETLQETLTSDSDEVVAGSVWRRRRNDNRVLLCRVEQVTDTGYVAYRIIHNPSNLPVNSLDTNAPPPLMEEDQFIEHWDRVKSDAAAITAINNEPFEGTFWRHIESRQVVRIAPASVTQRMNRQTPYVTLEMEHASVASQTFQRLYREMPFPPTKTVWIDASKMPYDVLSIDGVHDYRNLKVVLRSSTAEKVVPFYQLLEEYDPLAFEESSLTDLDIRTGSEWSLKQGNATVRVKDVGTVRDLEFVRFVDAAQNTLLLEVEPFLQMYEVKSIVAPTAVGDEWSFGGRVSYKVAEIRLWARSVILERGEDTIEVPFDRLVQSYSRIERRPAFAVLDEGWEDD